MLRNWDELSNEKYNEQNSVTKNVIKNVTKWGMKVPKKIGCSSKQRETLCMMNTLTKSALCEYIIVIYNNL